MYEELADRIGRNLAAPAVRFPPRPVRTFKQKVNDLVDASNAQAQPTRRVLKSTAQYVAKRSLETFTHLDADAQEFSALIDLEHFLDVARTGRGETAHTGLLPAGHPRSTTPALSTLTASAVREARGRWYAADPELPDEIRPLVAAALGTAPDSPVCLHAEARLQRYELPADIKVALEENDTYPLN